MNKREEFKILRESKRLVIINMNTCQKLLVEDESLLEKTDEELELIYKDYLVQLKQHSINNRV